MTKAKKATPTLQLRINGRLAEEILRIAAIEQNSVSAVARRLISQAIGTSDYEIVRSILQEQMTK